MALIKRGGVWHFRKMINGNIVARSTKTGDKKQAEQIAAKWESEAVQELVIKGTKPVSVHAAIKAFLNARKGTGGYSSACLHMEWWLKLPNVPLKKIAIHQLQDIVQERIEAGAAHNTVAVTVIYWNALMNFADKQGWSGGVKLPSMKRQRTRMRILSHEEEARLLEAINPKGHYPGKCIKNDIARQANADFVTCLLHTGARYSEIAHMTWDQVDFKERTIFIKRKKNGNDTLLVMSDAVFEVLSRRKVTVLGHHIFPSKLNNSNSYKWLDKALEKAGISDKGGKITIHHLRHTFATRMLNSGLSLVEVQSLLGHKHLTSTAVYLHVQKTAVASRAASVLNQMEAIRQAQAA